MNTFRPFRGPQKRHLCQRSTRDYNGESNNSIAMARLSEETENGRSTSVTKRLKTASHEYVFETLVAGEVEFQKSQFKDWMAHVEVPVPKAIAANRTSRLFCDLPRSLWVALL